MPFPILHCALSAQPNSREASPASSCAVPLSRHAIFFSVATFGCALDLWTKHWIFQWPRGPGQRGEWWLIEGYVGIQQAVNTGALFGMGQGQTILFAALSVVAVLGILCWLFIARAARDLTLTIALGCVMGGILGNLYDRLGLWGGRGRDGQPLYAVRDWILLCYGQYTWPNFNIADCLLVCGAGLLAWHALAHQESPSPPKTPA